MQIDRTLNKRRTVQNVKERLKWIVRLERMTGLPNRLTVDTSAHKLIISDDHIKDLPERCQRWHESLVIIVNDLNRVENSTARKILIERFYSRYFENYRELRAPKIHDYDILKRWGWSETKYYNYKQAGMLDFARIHEGGELLAYDGA